MSDNVDIDFSGNNTSWNEKKRFLENQYRALIKEKEFGKYEWCTRRTALRALCFNSNIATNTYVEYKLAQANILLSLDRFEKYDYATNAANAAADAANVVDVANAARVACVTAAVAAVVAGDDAAVVFAASAEAAEADADSRFSRFAFADAVVATDAADAAAATVAATVAVRASHVYGASNQDIDANFFDDNGINLLDLSISDLVNHCNGNLSTETKYTLWPTDKLLAGQQLEKNLFDKLRVMQLDFLSKDLELLFRNRPIDRIERYKLQFSRVIESDAELLRRAIVLGETTKPSQDVRIVLLGSGGAGKTELAKRLRNEKSNGSYQLATIGLDIQSHQPIDLLSVMSEKKRNEVKKRNTQLTTYLWDFGGQRLFHGLHSVFLHENCVYVLVIDNRHEQAVDEWLHQVQHQAGSNATVLIVTNEYENCFSKQNETRLRRQFPGLISESTFHYFSCLTPEILEFYAFVERLVECCLDSRKRVFSTTLEVMRALKYMYKEKHFIHSEEIDNVVSNELLITERDESIHRQLKQLGRIVELRESGGIICLDPEWLVESAYRLINTEILRRHNGVISQTEVRQNIDEIFAVSKETRYVIDGLKVERDDIERLFQFIEEVGQCTKVSNGKYLFPDAASSNEPVYPDLYSVNENSLDILFDLPYFPIGVHASLVSRLNSTPNLSVDPIYTWREGFVLQHSETGQAPEMLVTVQYELRSGSIHVHTLHQDLNSVCKALDSIKMNLDVIMKSTSIEMPVTPYISRSGRLQKLDWDSFSSLLRKDGTMVNNIYGDYAMGDKYVNKDNSYAGGQQLGGKANTYHQTTVDGSIDKNSSEVLSIIIEHLITNNAGFNADEHLAVAEVNKALEVNDQGKLANVWAKLQGITGFTADASTIVQFVLDNQSGVMAALASGIATVHALTS